MTDFLKRFIPTRESVEEKCELDDFVVQKKEEKHPKLGGFFRLQSNSSIGKFILVEKVILSETEFRNQLGIAKSAFKLKHGSVLAPIGLSHKQFTALCSSNYRLRVFYPNFECDLKSYQEHLSKSHPEGFFSSSCIRSQIYLFNLFFQIAEGLMYLEKNNIHLVPISPQTIFVEKENDFRILPFFANTQSLDDFKQFQLTSVMKKEPIYLTEELFKTVLTKSTPNVDLSKSNVFSLGLLILEAGLNKSIQGIYSQKNKLDFNHLQSLLLMFENKYKENTHLVQLVKKMLIMEEKSRPNIKELLSQLPSANQITSLCHSATQSFNRNELLGTSSELNQSQGSLNQILSNSKQSSLPSNKGISTRENNVQINIFNQPIDVQPPANNNERRTDNAQFTFAHPAVNQKGEEPNFKSHLENTKTLQMHSHQFQNQVSNSQHKNDVQTNSQPVFRTFKTTNNSSRFQESETTKHQNEGMTQRSKLESQKNIFNVINANLSDPSTFNRNNQTFEKGVSYRDKPQPYIPIQINKEDSHSAMTNRFYGSNNSNSNQNGVKVVRVHSYHQEESPIVNRPVTYSYQPLSVQSGHTQKEISNLQCRKEDFFQKDTPSFEKALESGSMADRTRQFMINPSERPSNYVSRTPIDPKNFNHANEEVAILKNQRFTGNYYYKEMKLHQEIEQNYEITPPYGEKYMRKIMKYMQVDQNHSMDYKTSNGPVHFGRQNMSATNTSVRSENTQSFIKNPTELRSNVRRI